MNKPKGKYAWTAKVGEKGQIVIPKEARTVFNIQPGDTLILLGDESQGIAIVKQEMLVKFAETILKTQQSTEELL
ncbi:MAG: AbrB/MazE/SpoVT family DNA-binding domain-containing protein [Anaerolineales bacterium]|nr:AbrB/MazE/SpoVT family DNA-binding domain-containing protein [Anaerolineales bacterium]